MFRVSFLVLVVMSSIAFAQKTEVLPCDPKPQVVNFYEIGITNGAELKLRLEEYFQKLTAEPNSQGHVINYGLDKDVARREKLIREFIVLHNNGAFRITLVRGGNEKTLKTELWIVPSGADYPTPNYSKDLKTKDVKNTDSSIRVVKTFKVDSIGCQTVEKNTKLGKFDAFGKVSERYFNWTLKEFAENLEFGKTLKGYVLVYGSEEEINDLQIRIRKFELLKTFIDERVIFINSGFRKESVTELWIVSEGTQPPQP